MFPHDPGRYFAGAVENGIAGQYRFAGRSCTKARIHFNSGKRTGKRRVANRKKSDSGF
jgi:hypothetical protein